MSREIILTSAKEILDFFEAHPELNYDQMESILTAYAFNEIKPILFVPVDKTRLDMEKPKRQLLDWVRQNLNLLDNHNELMPIPFFEAFKDK